MCKNCMCTAGIIFNTVGTLLSLWTVITTSTKDYGTAAEIDDRPNRFPKEKRKVILGLALIFGGNILQIAALYLF